MASDVTTRRRRPWFGLSVFVALAATAVLALFVAPDDAAQGDAYRLIYVHVPSMWLAYLAFALTSIASVLYLLPRTRRREWDLLAGASAEVGVLFTALGLALGAIWGKPIWGTWWTWDARLTTTAILLFLYLGYLAIRRIQPGSVANARRAAVAALIAFVDVPIVHLSVDWWEGQHQKATVFDRQLGEANMSTSMSLVLLTSVAAFTLLFVYLVVRRRELLTLEEGLEERELEAAIRARVSGVASA
jgi:heme exporter protein C